MPAKFDKLGLRFQYPENWQLDLDDAADGLLAVTVNSPTGGFWSVTMHRSDADVEELTEDVLDAMQQEYQGIEVEAVTETIADQEVSGYDMNFFYLDLVGSAQVRSFSTEAMTLLIHCQAEDREFKQQEQVFRAMLTSLILGSDL